MGENKKKNALNKFINGNQPKKNEIVLGAKEGLIERVDKIYVTKDGRQLLREQY